MLNFGLHLHLEGLNYDDVRNIAVECENLGFHSLWFYDHLLPISTNRSEPILDCLTTLAAIATNTKTLRLGTLVLCNSYRHPSILAKMGATLDVISNGRLEFGIGAGWKEDEYKAYGIPFPSASIRIGQLKEAVQIIKEMWTAEKTTFKGKYYSLTDAICEPKPLQKPTPPIWIGGKGEKLMLKVVAKLADGCNFLQVTPGEYKHKLDVLRKYTDSYGRDPNKFQKSFTATILLANETDEVEKLARSYVKSQVSYGKISTAIRHPRKALAFANEFLRRKTTRFGIIGTPEQCIDQIEKYVELGVTYFIFEFPSLPDLSALKLFAQYVMPMLKKKFC